MYLKLIRHGIVSSNPMDLVFHQVHERKHGPVLTKEEEKLLKVKQKQVKTIKKHRKKPDFELFSLKIGLNWLSMLRIN